MFQIETCYGSFDGVLRWEKDENFVCNFSIDVDRFIIPKVDEWHSEVNESQ